MKSSSEAVSSAVNLHCIRVRVMLSGGSIAMMKDTSKCMFAETGFSLPVSDLELHVPEWCPAQRPEWCPALLKMSAA